MRVTYMYYSDDVLGADDLYDMQEQVSSGIPVRYRLTEDEMDWLESLATGRYTIAEYMIDNLDEDVLTICSGEVLSRALDADNGNSGGFAVCLSKDTALARIFFWLYREDLDEVED